MNEQRGIVSSNHRKDLIVSSIPIVFKYFLVARNPFLVKLFYGTLLYKKKIKERLLWLSLPLPQDGSEHLHKTL